MRTYKNNKKAYQQNVRSNKDQRRNKLNKKCTKDLEQENAFLKS